MKLSPDMSDMLLLSTKLKIPVPRRDYVVRKALYEKLSECGDMGVIFVRGGAGTGKTTLLSSFIRETGLRNVSWLSLDSSNTNVYSFWLYFTAAVDMFLEKADDFLTLMRTNLDASHMEKLLIMLINQLCSEDDYYIVLDDVHCINDVMVVQTLENFISAMPPNFHIFMLSREDPPVYLGSLAVSGRLLFIDGKQMKLSHEEGMMFLKQTLKLSGSEVEMNELNAYSEGWIGGLQLAVAAGVGSGYSGELLRADGGIAAEYLTREIFNALTEKEKDFLTVTGFISYFDVSICIDIFDNFTQLQFNEMLETLIKKNLFIICIDEQNGVYRYHNILSEYLLQQFTLMPEERKKAYCIRIAKAFEKRGDYEEALRECCVLGDYEKAFHFAKLMEGRIEAWSYLDTFPLDKLMEDVELATQCFMYNLGNINVERCRLLYERFKEKYSDLDIFKLMNFAEIYVLCNEGILPVHHVFTTEQIEAMKLGALAKSMILVENSVALLEHMQYEGAKSCVNMAIENCSGTNIFVEFFAYNQMAQICEETGDLNDSLVYYEKSKKLIKSPGMMSRIGIKFYFGLIGVYMLRMELDKAEETLNKGIKLLKEQHITVDITDITMYHHIAEMKFLRGDAHSGAICVREILSKYPSFSLLNLVRLIHELDCTGMLSAKLGDDFLKELEGSKSYKLQPFMRLLRAQLLFHRGETVEALKETEAVLTFSRQNKNSLRLVGAGLLKIFMLLHSKESSIMQREINNLLREAVYYAHKDQIIMPFYLYRTDILPLLQKLIAEETLKNVMSDAEIAFMYNIIDACSEPKEPESEQEILSTREMQVLGELAQGITNREIAERLCISQATVKSHVLSIFSKLGVSSRMMAAEEARKKGLI